MYNRVVLGALALRDIEKLLVDGVVALGSWTSLASRSISWFALFFVGAPRKLARL